MNSFQDRVVDIKDIKDLKVLKDVKGQILKRVQDTSKKKTGFLERPNCTLSVMRIHPAACCAEVHCR